jgi:hypothetical protein
VLGLALLPGSAVSQQETLKDQFIGAWMLVSIDNVLPDGKKQQLFGTSGLSCGVSARNSPNGSFEPLHAPTGS